MDFFSDALARLKTQLRVSKDGEVAEFLGLSKTAFSERKRRASFPEKELVDLATRRPELGLDVGYVLGLAEAASAEGAMAAMRGAISAATGRATAAGAAVEVRPRSGAGSGPQPDWRIVLAEIVNALHARRRVFDGEELARIVDGMVVSLKLNGISEREEIRREIAKLFL